MSTTLTPAQHRTIEYMESIGAHALAANLRACNQTTVLFRDPEDNSIHYSPTPCNSQFCPVCGARRRRFLLKELQGIFDHFNLHNLKHVVLTRKSRPGEPLGAAAHHFRKSLNRLRATKWWRKRVKGYYLKYEIEYNDTFLSWHFHAHMIVLAGYLKKKELKELWHRATRGSYILSINACDQNAKYELTKYVTKWQKVPDEKALELIRYLQDHRMYSWGGLLARWRRDNPVKPEAPGWQYIGTLPSYISSLDQFFPSKIDFEICHFIFDNRTKFPDLLDHLLDDLLLYLLNCIDGSTWYFEHASLELLSFLQTRFPDSFLTS